MQYLSFSLEWYCIFIENHRWLAVVPVTSCRSGQGNEKHGLFSEVCGHGLGGLAVGSEGAEQGASSVINDDLRASLP